MDSAQASKYGALLLNRQQCTTEFNTEVNSGIREFRKAASWCCNFKNRQDLNKVGEEMYCFQLKISG